MKMKDVFLKAQVAFLNWCDSTLAPHQAKVDKVERVARRSAVMGPVASLLLMASAPAHAAGIADFFKWFTANVLQPGLMFLVYIGYVGGVIAVAIGIYKFIQCSRQNSHTSPMEATAYCFGGGALGAVGYIADKMSESMAMGSSGGGWNARSY